MHCVYIYIYNQQEKGRLSRDHRKLCQNLLESIFLQLKKNLFNTFKIAIKKCHIFQKAHVGKAKCGSRGLIFLKLKATYEKT